MKNEIVAVFGIAVLATVIAFWVFLATTYWLTCKSYEVFDNAETRFVFPGVCYTSINGGPWEDRTW